jgi:hypothetical protein
MIMINMTNLIRFELNKVVKRVLIVSLAIVIAGLFTGCTLFGGSAGIQDALLSNLELITNGSQVTGVRFSILNSGEEIPAINYQIIFSEDTTIDPTDGDYIVYEHNVSVAENGTKIVEVDFDDLSPWMAEEALIAPAGEYYFGVIVDPDNTVPEEWETNNEDVSLATFTYNGSVPGITLDFTYDFNAPLNTENPLRILIMDSWNPLFINVLFEQMNDVVDVDAAQNDGWVSHYTNITVDEEGVIFIPATDLPTPDPDSTGYYVFLFHDSGADWDFQSNRYIHLDEGYGRYDSTGTGNVIYTFSHHDYIELETHYNITFAPTALPVDDAYVDNDTLATAHDFGLLSSGTTSSSNLKATDNDWYKIYVNGTGVNLEVDLSFIHTDLNLYMEFYDASGNLIETVDTNNNIEEIRHVVATPGSYFVRVYHLDGTLGVSPYSIVFRVN